MWRAAMILALLGLSTAARADSPYSDPAEQRWSWYVGNPAACDSRSVLDRIASRFGTTEGVYWKDNLSIGSFDRVRELSFRGNGTEYIPRRYCIARAHFSDESYHTVIYDIIENQGIIGVGDGIESCFIGLDRLHAFSPACHNLRPVAERSLGSEALVERY